MDALTSTDSSFEKSTNELVQPIHIKNTKQEKTEASKKEKKEKQEKAKALKQEKQEKAKALKQEKQEKAKALKQEKNNKIDIFTSEILRGCYYRFKNNYIEDTKLINSGIPIRHQNPPEHITENIVKFTIQNYDNDPSCEWAKCVGQKGDLCSKKYPINSPPEVKAFTSHGPASFGPRKKFGVIYFLDMREWLNDTFTLWKVNVSNDSPEWNQIKMNKKQTLEDQCKEGKRPHIPWDNIYSQIPDKCVKVYEGTFEGIFTPPVTVSVSVQ